VKLRVLVFAVALCSFAWLTYESLHFRKAIRTNKGQVYSETQRSDPEAASAGEKMLNGYYESIYRDLPSILVPSLILLGCSVALLFLPGRSKLSN
jgi:hypothetical protein